MSNTISLEDRMKQYYEGVPKTRLVRRMPVICRIDGTHFHTFLKGFKRPFDIVFIKTMQDTARSLCEQIPGCVLTYQQSDEITLLLVDYRTHTTQAWFDYEVQKMCSVGASIATLAFNKALEKNFDEYCRIEGLYKLTKSELEYRDKIKSAIDKGATFVFRCFNIPKEEVANCLLWRQQDASRNSIQMVAQSKFYHKQLDQKSTNEMQDMLMNEYEINWNDYATYLKRGSCCFRENRWYNIEKLRDFENAVKQPGALYLRDDDIMAKELARYHTDLEYLLEDPGNNEYVQRTRVRVDLNIPKFSTAEGRNYIESRVYIGN